MSASVSDSDGASDRGSESVSETSSSSLTVIVACRRRSRPDALVGGRPGPSDLRLFRTLDGAKERGTGSDFRRSAASSLRDFRAATLAGKPAGGGEWDMNTESWSSRTLDL